MDGIGRDSHDQPDGGVRGPEQQALYEVTYYEDLEVILGRTSAEEKRKELDGLRQMAMQDRQLTPSQRERESSCKDR